MRRIGRMDNEKRKKEKAKKLPKFELSRLRISNPSSTINIGFDTH